MRSQASLRVAWVAVLALIVAMGPLAARSLFVDRINARCVGGLSDGLLCPEGDECVTVCVGGANDGLVCPLGDECIGVCVGGLLDGELCEPDDPVTNVACRTDGGTCEAGVCDGVCAPGAVVEDGSANRPFITINGALAISVESDIIQVAPGVYHEIINVPFGVDMRGADPLTTIIDGDGQGAVVTFVESPGSPFATAAARWAAVS